MKPFNSALNTDITKLKEILDQKGRKDPGYADLFKKIMERHDISRTTVYTELAKDQPGAYKKRNHKAGAVKISKREMDILALNMIGGKNTTDELCKAMTTEMGFSY